MRKKLKRNKQKRAEDAKSFIKLPMTRLEHTRLNVFKSLTNTDSQNFPEFVMMNKKEFFEQLDRKMLDKIKDFASLGFFYALLFNIISCLRSR